MWSMNPRIFVIPWDKVHDYLAIRSTFRLAPASFWPAITVWALCWLSGPIGSWGLTLPHSLVVLIFAMFLRSAFLPGFWVPLIEEEYLETKFWILGVFNKFSQLLLGFLSPDRNRRWLCIYKYTRAHYTCLYLSYIYLCVYTHTHNHEFILIHLILVHHQSSF